LLVILVQQVQQAQLGKVVILARLVQLDKALLAQLVQLDKALLAQLDHRDKTEQLGQLELLAHKVRQV